MRELDCDFCGARAAGAYEVVPSELDPTPEEQVRVVLCERCRTTLDSVTAPLLARLGATSDPAADLGGDTRAASATDPAQSTLESGADDGDADAEGPEDGAQASARSENPVSPADDAVIIDSGAPRTRRGNEDGADGAERRTMDASDVAAVRRATAAEQDPVPDDSGPEAADDDGASDDGGADADDADESDGAVGADGADEAGTESDDETAGKDGRPERSRPGEPDEFRTVMRLLNNREFPVDRAEITDLASGAYELEVSEVEAIIDHAIERDVLAENRGKLTKA
ncbi:hypothetical protein [Halorarum salinum]|uniref:Uncharacterized protein n=1 Tax=Halorarum salinum TaxID=2743089 RepID=A0A7D5QFK7_9EURY|nr:hypothetical protein [Halobaculum salinum]QLG60764.1 hypothetical protein HUG12_02980 [Halobaculum salinum]